jgi:hypothetical protein
MEYELQIILLLSAKKGFISVKEMIKVDIAVAVKNFFFTILAWIGVMSLNGR